MACRLCVWLFICFCLLLMYFFYLHPFLLLPCDDPCTVLNVFLRVQKAAKIKKKAVCKKKKEREIEEEQAFFNHRLHVCVHHQCNFHKHRVKYSFRSGCLGSVRAYSILTNYWQTSHFWAATEKIWSQNCKADLHRLCIKRSYSHPCVLPFLIAVTQHKSMNLSRNVLTGKWLALWDSLTAG